MYGLKRGGTHRLVNVRWATLESRGEQRGKFEQKSALAGCDSWEPLNDDAVVHHNPTPSML